MSDHQTLSVSCLPSVLLSTDGSDQDTDNTNTSVQPSWSAEDVNPPPPPPSMPKYNILCGL